MEQKTKGYKGFDKELKCREFQYKVGETYKTDNAEVCETGFHFCENPFDVFSYYPPSCEKGVNRFCEVEGGGKIDKDCDGSKIACSEIKIGAEIKLDGIINAGVKFILDKVKWVNNKDTNTGYRSVATNTGDYSAATNTGNRSAATNTGNRSAASVEGKESIAIATGKDSRAKGALGCWIVLAERDEWNGESYPILNVKAFKVDNLQVKADTYYMLVNGELKEAE